MATQTIAKTPFADRVSSELTRTLYRNCPVGVISAACVALFVAWAMPAGEGFPLNHAATAWAMLVVTCAAVHLVLCAIYWRAKPGDEVWRRWLGLFTLVAFIEGLVWAAGATWLTANSNFTQALILLLAWTGVCSGGAIVFGPCPWTYLAFFYPAMLPHIYFALHNRYPMYGVILALEIAYLIALPLIAWRYSAQLIESARLRFANLDLANDLRVQKDRAEQANLAKSSFLAAASHDLRQPVHALSLFIGALRHHRMGREAQRLVDHIDNSVATMDDLFTSLLDISKLDAGTVQARPQPFAIAPMLGRICSEFSAEASQKGIRLMLVGCTLCVDSDSLLVERIARNLVSNAVRHTVRGRVLVGCRRSADSVRFEVWDTGPGIPAHHHALIFQEFFQSGNPERDRARGLGLGLAIVQRLAGIIGAPVAFRSEPGEGSVFSLTLPRAAIAPQEAVTPLVVPSVRRGALIVVVDDEQMIREAMASLLAGWGYRVVVAGSGAQCCEQITALAATPDLVISDYRLRGAETGVSVIGAVRQAFGGGIAGDQHAGYAIAERMTEAEASGFLLLHKPLANAKLRAAIGNLLRAASN